MGLKTIAAVLFAAGLACLGLDNYQPSADAVAVPAVSFVRGHGSAVSLGDGLFLSAKHVTDDETALQLRLGTQDYSASFIRDYPGRDLALIRSELHLPAVPIRCEELPVGVPVRAVGYPGDTGLMTMRGYVAQPVRWDISLMLQVGPQTAVRMPYRALQWLDLRAAPGMSGGPVLDERNRLVGVTVIVNNIATAMVPAPAVCEALGKVI